MAGVKRHRQETARLLVCLRDHARRRNGWAAGVVFQELNYLAYPKLTRLVRWMDWAGDHYQIRSY